MFFTKQPKGIIPFDDIKNGMKLRISNKSLHEGVRPSAYIGEEGIVNDYDKKQKGFSLINESRIIICTKRSSNRSKVYFEQVK